jgi:hypothetical protein
MSVWAEGEHDKNTHTSDARSYFRWGCNLIVTVKLDNTLVVRASRIVSKAMDLSNYSEQHSTLAGFVRTTANLLFCCDDRTLPKGLQVMMRQRSAFICLFRKREKNAQL